MLQLCLLDCQSQGLWKENKWVFYSKCSKQIAEEHAETAHGAWEGWSLWTKGNSGMFLETQRTLLSECTSLSKIFSSRLMGWVLQIHSRGGGKNHCWQNGFTKRQLLWKHIVDPNRFLHLLLSSYSVITISICKLICSNFIELIYLHTMHRS